MRKKVAMLDTTTLLKIQNELEKCKHARMRRACCALANYIKTGTMSDLKVAFLHSLAIAGLDEAIETIEILGSDVKQK